MTHILKNHDPSKVIGQIDNEGIVSFKKPVLLSRFYRSINAGIDILEEEIDDYGQRWIKRAKIIEISIE
ncbi:MAG: hypothetical protein GWN01_07540 [Nitrosopumilaceae archaeon]|nr:hypothetical protein [Nitrosopumilaceae archaeon]NIU87222.1 hypothetical protein [Nitrosopumilaceae archaeon]NIX61375.1 hypothetical protein [Nitrosopumilaceae archaeon]